jgi:hypothetical protein
MAIEPPHALNGCDVLVESFNRYEHHLVTLVEPDHELRMSKPLLAERFCRLERLCDPKAFSALALIWKQSTVAPRLLTKMLAATDQIERARARYERTLGGSAPTARSGMFRQRVSRFLDAARTFGLVKLEIEIDGRSGKPFVKLVHATPELNVLMLAVGKDVAMLAAERFQSADGLSPSGDPGADGSR